MYVCYVYFNKDQSINQSIRSLDFVVDRFFMKLFETDNPTRSKKLENCQFVRL